MIQPLAETMRPAGCGGVPRRTVALAGFEGVETTSKYCPAVFCKERTRRETRTTKRSGLAPETTF